MVSGVGALGGDESWGGATMMGECPYTGDPGEPLSPSSSEDTVRKHHLWTRKWVLTREQILQISYCRLAASRNVRSRFLWLQLLSAMFSYDSPGQPRHKFSSVTQSCPTVTPRTAAHQASLSITTSWSLRKLMSTESGMPSNHLILCQPLLLPPFIFTGIRVLPVSQFFASGGQSIAVSASASVLPMNIQDWFPLGWIVGSPCCPRDS